MMPIMLREGIPSWVDDEDFDKINNGKEWRLHVNGYAYRTFTSEFGSPKTEYIHRVILGDILGEWEIWGKLVDHRNDDKLDNRRFNLRLANEAENARHRSRGRNNTSGIKGVSWCKRRKRWIAQIQFNKKRIWLGSSKDIEEARELYANGAFKYHGEFAHL